MFYCEGCDLNDTNSKNETLPEPDEIEEEEDNDEVVVEEGDDNDQVTTTATNENQTTTTIVNNKNIEIKPQAAAAADPNKRQQKSIQSNKYSISLPREIPDMFKRIKKATTTAAAATENQPSRPTVKRQQQEEQQQKRDKEANKEQKSNEAARLLSVSFQNVTNKNLIEELKEDIEKYSTDVTNGQQQANTVPIDANIDDDLDKFNEENDIGQAISYLASSIIAKDGRELFGCRPSRRVHINCISQSYF